MESSRKPGFLDEPEPGFNLALGWILVTLGVGMFVLECVRWSRTEPGAAFGGSVESVARAGLMLLLLSVNLWMCWRERVTRQPDGVE